MYSYQRRPGGVYQTKLALLLRPAHFVSSETRNAWRTSVISIIDDDTLVRDATATLIRSLGFAPAKFASAEAFLESDDIDHTQCLIVDVQLPGLSGIDLQRRLQADGRKIPVIFITAFPEERLRASAAAAGAVGVLSKPFDPEVLMDCLSAALERGSGRPH